MQITQIRSILDMQMKKQKHYRTEPFQTPFWDMCSTVVMYKCLHIIIVVHSPHEDPHGDRCVFIFERPFGVPVPLLDHVDL